MSLGPGLADLDESPRFVGASRRVVRAMLARVREGTVVLVEGERTTSFGEGRPLARVVVSDPRAYPALVRQGSVGLGASYAAGWWDCDELTDLVRILERATTPARRRSDALARRLAPLVEPTRRLHEWVRPPERVRTREEDRRHVAAHYDLSNDFFELMLDETMMYSCAFFERPEVTLAEAQRAKLDRLCRKLALSPEDHVVEIGTGWGGFALHAAGHYGCRVTTTTISDAQFEYATRRVAAAGLGDRVSVLNRDYRELEGTFDKLVSIEMIEAIGWRQLDTFFATGARLLEPGGLMGLQAIVIDDRSYERAKRREDFIKRLVFPGGFLPSIEAMTRSATRVSDLRVVDLEDIGRHYAETLARWRANLEARAASVAALGLGEPFARLWRMYLAYCEAAFLERHVSDVQVVFARDRWRGALAPQPTRA